MNNHQVIANKHRIDYLFACTDELRRPEDAEIKAQLAAYLCILVSGFVETTMQTLLYEYTYGKGHPNLIRYVNKTLYSTRSRNLKAGNLLQLIETFSEDWKKELEDFIEQNGRREALDSIIDLRNSISHGIERNISYARVKEYYEKILEIVDFIEARCI